MGMELSDEELALVSDWLAWAENEGASSTRSTAGKALSARIQAAMEPRIKVELTVSDIDRILRWYGESSDPEDEDDLAKDDHVAVLLSTGRKLAV